MRYLKIALEFKKGQLPILKNWAGPKKIGLPAHFLGLPIFDMNALIEVDLVRVQTGAVLAIWW